MGGAIQACGSIKAPNGRRSPWTTPKICLTAGMILYHAAAGAIGFSDIRAKAEALASKPHAPLPVLPAPLLSLDYDAHRGIAFNDKHSLWRDDQLPFQIGFFYPGSVYKHAIKINELDGAEVREVKLLPGMFEFGNIPPEAKKAPGFAGFRIMVAERAELGVFAGASYFRMIGFGQNYGSSARGLAIDTALPKTEEFPIFREFWVQKPAPGASSLTVFALLDSPSTTGAFQFIITPGFATVSAVKATLFARHTVERFGIAALTSMFMWDGSVGERRNDHRPQVHDADGLLIHSGAGEWLWRPLQWTKVLKSSSHIDENVRGFGLLQRDRKFAHYDDAEANYHSRPSVWVVPKGQWGRGSVFLAQLHGDHEGIDNIAAFWIPESPPKPGNALEVEYDIHWLITEPGPPKLRRVTETLWSKVQSKPPRANFAISFSGGSAEDIDPQVTVGPGAKLVEQSFDNAGTNGICWLRFVVEAAAEGTPVDLRARLNRRSEPASETWTFTWTP